jgi:catechol 2,3-dioxygenase-like lactoylglutathione lyase family enzyme
MKRYNLGLIAMMFVGAWTSYLLPTIQQENPRQIEAEQDEEAMQLGNFSVSLSVKDLMASKAFYEKLDFAQVGGEVEQNYVIMQNGTTTIGLFQGMFEKNMMTFNPGWNKDKETLETFDDVRAIQTKLKERGIEFTTQADVETSGPANFLLMDPDGNPILFDQHVDKPN